MNEIVKKIFSPFDFLFDRISGVAGAVIFLQIPQFITHYVQRLGGHVDELSRIVAQYRTAAAENGKGLDEYVSRFLNSSESDFVSAGKNMKVNIDRLADIKEALDHLSSAGPLDRFFYFIKDIDLEIARAAAKNFSPGISFTVESAVYALCGLLAGSLIYFGTKKLFGYIAGRFTGQP